MIPFLRRAIERYDRRLETLIGLFIDRFWNTLRGWERPEAPSPLKRGDMSKKIEWENAIGSLREEWRRKSDRTLDWGDH